MLKKAHLRRYGALGLDADDVLKLNPNDTP
jgi:hypothetical protein